MTKKSNKTIQLGNGGNILVKDLITALQRCKDSSRFTLKLCINEKIDESETESANLRKMLHTMHNLLADARRCVAICAENEIKTGEKLIYYDSPYNPNNGACGLLKDIDHQLNSYCTDLVQIDLKA